MAALQSIFLDSCPVDPSAAEMATQPTPSKQPLQPVASISRPPRGPPLWQIYKQPAPLRVFPFPTLNSNPISYIHLALSWLNQLFFPPSPEPSIIHNAFWDRETRTIVVTDEKSMSDLWQQGFYGKGSLSRSEPNWLKRERIRQGVLKGKVSEVATDQRREDRMRAKWERARVEHEAIEQKRREEEEAKAFAQSQAIEKAEVAAQAKARVVAKALAETQPVVEAREPTAVPATVVPTIRAPVGPLELLALPNSFIDLIAYTNLQPCSKAAAGKPTGSAILAPVGPLELLALPNSQADMTNYHQVNLAASVESIDNTDASIASSGSSGNDEAETDTTVSVDLPALNRRKSVRFSPKVESTVFIHTDPPSPPRSVSSSSLKLTDEKSCTSGASSGEVKDSQGSGDTVKNKDVGRSVQSQTPAEVVVVNKEHLQLAHEEAFFLAFALGALKVTDSATQQTLSTQDLFTLLRQNSYFPARKRSALQPDDPFLVHYAVYHHFRSLGFVPRPGIKFGVDCKLLPCSARFSNCSDSCRIRAPLQPRPRLRSRRIRSPRSSFLCRPILDVQRSPAATEVLALANGREQSSVQGIQKPCPGLRRHSSSDCLP